MAKQAGNIFVEGTLCDLTFYKMGGVYYVRMKSSLTGKKFRRDKAFERSRESSKRFAEGNKLASRIYRRIEKEKRVYSLFCLLKKRAILLLKEGRNILQAEECLRAYLQELGLIEQRSNDRCEKAPEIYFAGNLCDGKNFTQTNSGANGIRSLKFLKDYACAAGPPNVIGI